MAVSILLAISLGNGHCGICKIANNNSIDIHNNALKYAIGLLRLHRQLTFPHRILKTISKHSSGIDGETGMKTVTARYTTAWQKAVA